MFGAPSWGDSAGQDYDYSVVETGAIDDQGAIDDSKAGKKRYPADEPSDHDIQLHYYHSWHACISLAISMHQ